LLGAKSFVLMPMSSKAGAYMMLMLLPPSMSTLEERVFPMMGLTTSGYCPEFGMWSGWSSWLKEIASSD
jgi:hypothetical protein